MGLDNLDQNYYDPNFPGDNHPWGDNKNHEAWNEYNQLLKSGMFWEFYPELTGEWEQDREQWLIEFNKNKKTKKMDIGSGNGYPSASLSNFAGHRFIIDGIECNSMEGFLQSLKFKNPLMQVEICKLIGKAAKFRGKPKKWYREQVLYWGGEEIPRKSEKYQLLLDRAFQAMYDQSDSFKQALLASKGATLTHSMGKNDMSKTVLTNTEFIGRLNKLRECGKIY